MSDLNLTEIFENNFDCYTEVNKGKGVEEEMAMTKGKFLEIVEHILHQANGVDKNTEPALHKHIVSNRRELLLNFLESLRASKALADKSITNKGMQFKVDFFLGI